MKLAFYFEPLGQWGGLHPDDLEPGGRGLGGRETCLIYVSRELARRGHDVTVFCQNDGTEALADRGWLPWRAAYSRELRAFDVGISFSGTRPWTKGGLPSRIRVVHEQCAHLRIGESDALVDAYFMLSHWQGWHLNRHDPKINTDKMVTVYNGIDLARYQENGHERHPHRLFYSSSPDRGLHHLLEGWPIIRAEVPDAELWIFYEVDSWLSSVKWMMNEIGRRATVLQSYRDNPPEGVTWWGMIDKWTLAEKQQACNLWAYPAELVAGTETFCITGLEAAAAGCAMFTTSGDCLPEIYGEVAAMAELPVDVEGFAQGVVRLLTEPEVADLYRPGREFAEGYTWQKVADNWERELLHLVEGVTYGEDDDT